jgi:hypothetical protein
MAQILQPFQTAVGSLSDSINSFFGVGRSASELVSVASAPVTVETDPHYYSAARWIQEINR